jgi:hypothetical protein
MDFGLYLSVLWRFRALVVLGLLLTVGLAFLSFVRVEWAGGTPKLEPRASETWSSTAVLLVTEKGFPWGVSSLQDPEALAQGRPPAPNERLYSDPTRFQALAVLYSRFAVADAVRKQVAETAPRGSYTATPVKIEDGGNYLPMIGIVATSDSSAGARNVAKRATGAFQSYLERLQRDNQIPAERRVEVQVVNAASAGTLVSGRSPLKPLMIMLLGLALTFGLAFALENLRPRARPEAAAIRPNAPMRVLAERERSARSG